MSKQQQKNGNILIEIFYFENAVIKSLRISRPECLSFLNIGVILQAAESDFSISKTSVR